MKNKFKNYLYIIVLAIIVSIPLLNQNYNIYRDDGIQHVCRIMGTFQSITEGQTFPVIMSNFCNEFGYSWNLFYSPITAYIPLLFHFITNSFVLDIKIFMIFVTILSGITMYNFLFKITKNKYIGLLGAGIYMLAPYRLTDMYIRMALAELASFIFLPMVFEGIYRIFNEENNSKSPQIIMIIGAAGLILTHLVIALYTAIISAIYILINIKKLKNIQILKQLILCLIVILCITSFFWVPLLEHKVNTQYEVFKEGRMERTDALIYHKLDILQLIYTKQSNMCFEIGLFTLIGIAFTPIVWKKIDKEYKQIYIFALITGIISIIMTLKCFPFEKLPSILKMLQFSFRMLEFSSFFFSIVVAINYIIIIKDFKKRDLLVLTFILILLTIPFTRNISYVENINESKLWPAVTVTEKTGRVHAGCASFEYLPSKAFENLEYIKTRKNRVYILEGSGEINSEQKNGTNMKFQILNTTENTILELPYIYYLGYEVYIETNGEQTKIDILESENGFISIKLKNEVETGNVSIKYIGTNIMKISMIISIISFTTIIIYYVKAKRLT